MEIWKDIPGYEGLYQVSDQGRVRSLDMVLPHWYGGTRIRKGRILKMSERNGYLYVELNHKGKGIKFNVGVLVLSAFVGPRSDGNVCRHCPDPDKHNNNLNNLMWGTQADNHNDAVVYGTFGPHRNDGWNGCAKLTKLQVLEIRCRYAAGGMKQVELAREYGVSTSVMNRLLLRKTWSYI